MALTASRKPLLALALLSILAVGARANAQHLPTVPPIHPTPDDSGGGSPPPPDPGGNLAVHVR